MGILAKGSISQLVKTTRSTSTEPGILDKDKILWLELINNDFTDNSIASIEQMEIVKTLPTPSKDASVSTVQTEIEEPLPILGNNTGASTKQTDIEQALPVPGKNTGASTKQTEIVKPLPAPGNNTGANTKQTEIAKPLPVPCNNTGANTKQTEIVKPLPVPGKNTGAGSKQAEIEKPLPNSGNNTDTTENKVGAEISDPSSQTSEPILKKNTTSLADTKSDDEVTNFINQLRKSYYKRMIVNTTFSVRFDGILTSVNDDFIILITDQLSIVSIPLLCIVSFYIYPL